jgi:hypothetical protein
METKQNVPPVEVPETAATYERTRGNTSVKGSETVPPRATPESERPAPTSDRSAPLPPGGEVAGDMTTEEPDGWDLAPNDIQEAEQKRHPRPDGVGGSDPNNSTRNERRRSELDG